MDNINRSDGTELTLKALADNQNSIGVSGQIRIVE